VNTFKRSFENLSALLLSAFVAEAAFSLRSPATSAK